MSIAKSASIRQAHWDCPSEETTQTRGSNFLGAVLLFRRLKLPKGASLPLLRRSQYSHLLPSGVPLPAVSARLGHGSIRTTQEIYSHMIHGQDDEAARKWEEFQNQTAGDESQQKGRVQ
jgi:integrase